MANNHYHCCIYNPESSGIMRNFQPVLTGPPGETPGGYLTEAGVPPVAQLRVPTFDNPTSREAAAIAQATWARDANLFLKKGPFLDSSISEKDVRSLSGDRRYL
jgi:hypothetical protein